jgi:hypothetical protein
MIPTLVIVRVRGKRSFLLPLPLFLLWPLAALAVLLLGVVHLAVPPARAKLAPAWMGLRLFARARGLQVDVRDPRGEHVYVRVV